MDVTKVFIFVKECPLRFSKHNCKKICYAQKANMNRMIKRLACNISRWTVKSFYNNTKKFQMNHLSSVSILWKKELNLMLKAGETSSQGAVGLS